MVVAGFRGRDVGVGGVGDGRVVLVEGCDQRRDDLRLAWRRLGGDGGGAGSRGSFVSTRIEGATMGVGVGHGGQSGYGRRATSLVPVTWDCTRY